MYMLKVKHLPISLISWVIVLIVFSSCNNHVADIPFPFGDSSRPQPIAQRLKLSEPQKLTWTLIKSDAIKPEIRKLDINALPSEPFDTTGFKPIQKQPEEVRFDFNALPSKPFDLEKIPSQDLISKRAILLPPIINKSARLSPKTNSTISISELGVGQGLPDKTILTFLKDRNGFVWIGTTAGLYRFDGEYMLSYPSYHGGVADLVEDRLGRLWYITDQVFGMIDTKAGIYTYSNQIHTFFPALPRMIMDDKGQIWITRIANGGAIVFDPEHEKFKSLNGSTGLVGDKSTVTTGAYQDNQKNIWIPSISGLNIINLKAGKISYMKTANGLPNDTLRALDGDKHGSVWISFQHGGVVSVNLNKGTITAYGQAQGFNNTVNNRVFVDDRNMVWMATNNRGLCVLDPDHGRHRYFYDKDGMAEDYALDVFEDDMQRIWVASANVAPIIIEDYGEMVRPVGTRSVSTLMEDPEGRIWIGAGNSTDGIQIIDRNRKQMKFLNKRHGLGDNFIQNLMQVNGEIWITTDGGFDRIYPNQKKLEHYGKAQGLRSDSLYNTFVDTRGNIWISGPNGGIDLIDYSKKQLLHAGAKEGLSEDNIQDMKSDNQGKIWIATYSKGVDVYNPVAGTIQNLSQGPGLMDSSYRILMKDSYGRIWIGTDKGIYVADTRDSSLTSISIKEGLTNNYITSLLEYHGNVVVATRSRGSVINSRKPDYGKKNSNPQDSIWKISNMWGTESLGSVNQNWNTNIITKKGEYVWGDIGLIIIDSIKAEEATAPTMITGIYLMNEPLYFTNKPLLKEKDTLWGLDTFYVSGQVPKMAGFSKKSGVSWDSISGANNLPVNFALSHDPGNLQFQFGQQHLGRPDVTMYSYILEGVDNKWTVPSPKTSTENYLNPPPGTYTFKVCSMDLSGHWSKPASLSFTVLPPWWQTWWMYIIYALAVIAAIFGYNKYRSKALLNENRILEERVQARTMEVKQQADELKTINQISQALVGQADLKDLIQLVGNQLRDLFKANIVYIALLDKKSRIINFPYQHGDNLQPMRLGEGLTSKIILSGQPLLINKDVGEKTVGLGVERVGVPAASYLGVPIPVSNEIIGVLSIQSTEKENQFAEKDKNLLTTIAANVGVAIRKARLFEEVKQANTDADAARKNAEEANAAKSAFLSTVSHELRTPLTSVLGFARITKKRLEEKIFPITDKSDPKTVKTIDQISGNLDVVIAEGERLTNLINDVLDLAKIEAGKMEWNIESVNMTEIVERAIASTSSLFDQKNLQLKRDIEANLPEISGDRDKLIQVVVNLLSNAVKFTNQGIVTCSAFQKEGGIVVGITDTGIGIAPEDHDKVFEQFKQVGDTLTDKPKGTGLGLPICKEIVEHHGGKIWLESNLGQGSTFYFMLPVMKTNGKPAQPIQLNALLEKLKTRVAESQLSLKNEHATILVVDDDDGIRSLLKQELGDAGYLIEEAANGKEAISKIRSNRPNLVILDVMMPEMNGFDVAAILKNDPQTMDIPIIILSIVQDKSRGFRIGVDRYLTKPIDTGLLFTEIGSLLEQGKSKKRVMVVDEDSVIVRTLAEVLQAKGYQVVESDGKELIQKAISTQPDIIILNSVISDKQEVVQTLRFEKGLENVLFLIYQ